MNKRVLFTILLICLPLVSFSQDVLNLPLASFTKWVKMVNNSGYPKVTAGNDENLEYSATFMLSMEKVFYVKVTPLNTLQQLTEGIENAESFTLAGNRVVYGLKGGKAHFVAEVKEKGYVFLMRTDEKNKRAELEEIATNIKFNRIDQ